ncbi:unnamed protein product, partial [Prorocentrum cordatum]
DEVSKQSVGIESQVQSALAPGMDSLTRRLEMQIDEHAELIASISSRADGHDAAVAALQAQVSELQRQLVVAAEAPRPSPLTPSSFARDVDSTIVVGVSQQPAASASIVAVLRPRRSGIGFGDSEFEIKQRGGQGDSSFKGANSRREFWIDRLGSGRRRLHLGPDKCPKQIKLEVTLRMTRQLVDAQYPGKRLLSDRERGAPSVGQDTTMQIEVFHGDPPPKMARDARQLRRREMSVDALRTA